MELLTGKPSAAPQPSPPAPPSSTAAPAALPGPRTGTQKPPAGTDQASRPSHGRDDAGSESVPQPDDARSAGAPDPAAPASSSLRLPSESLATATGTTSLPPLPPPSYASPFANTSSGPLSATSSPLTASLSREDDELARASVEEQEDEEERGGDGGGGGGEGGEGAGAAGRNKGGTERPLKTSLDDLPLFGQTTSFQDAFGELGGTTWNVHRARLSTCITSAG